MTAIPALVSVPAAAHALPHAVVIAVWPRAPINSNKSLAEVVTHRPVLDHLSVCKPPDVDVLDAVRPAPQNLAKPQAQPRHHAAAWAAPPHRPLARAQATHQPI